MRFAIRNACLDSPSSPALLSYPLWRTDFRFTTEKENCYRNRLTLHPPDSILRNMLLYVIFWAFDPAARCMDMGGAP